MNDVLIRVRNIEFTGAGDGELPALESAARGFPTANIPALGSISSSAASFCRSITRVDI